MTHKVGIPNAGDGVSPIGLAREIQERYHGYLRTSFYFRDPLLRRSFEDELAQGQLVNGPFVEATPVYSRETTTSALLAELHRGDVDAGFMAALDPQQRRLYVHQEQAVRRLNRGRNVIVATGTGSGKTEAYLLPILLALYRESLLGERAPGVRALILYPMNALANDQCRRLREFAMRLAARGSKFSFTFGRYTGETPEDERDSFRNARRLLGNRKPGDGELVLRREMRERPPDILLTNYSMLEYLLLRPKDSLLFDNGRGSTWRFCVLDEAHQYRGTKGMEMAMLLRRLKERLREGGLAQRIQCVATSASLGGGPGRTSNLAAFARELFDEPFEEEDVLLEDVTRSTTTGTVSVPASDFQALSRALEAGDRQCEAELQKLANRCGITLGSESGMAERLHRVLSADHRLAKLRTILDTPRLANDVRDAVFDEVPEDRREEVLEAYLHLVTSARDPESDAPLLTLRYHLFLRALEGAFVRYWPDKRVSLARAGAGAVSVEGKGDSGSWFEVALCRECGQHYFVGRCEGGFLREALRDYGDDDFSVSFFRPVELSEGDDDAKRARLCVICGALSASSQRPGDPACGHHIVIDVVEEKVRDASKDQMRTCGACEYRGPDPVREIVHGTDGPNAVVATALHRLLPEDRRKVLGFVDGRQEAAFFAVYLERSYQSILGRSLLFATAQSLAREGYREVSLGSLAAKLTRVLRERGVVLASADDLQVRREAWKLVFSEFATDEPRISLEGVGLVRWLPVLPDDLSVPESLFRKPWSFGPEEARDLLRWLLDSLRSDFALELLADRGIDLSWEDLGLNASQSRVEVGGGRGVRAWDGPRTRRTGFLVRALASGADAALDARAKVNAAQQLLREVWEALKVAGGEDRVLLQVGDSRRINPSWWRLNLVLPQDARFQCDTCGRHQSLSVRSVCGRHACPGTLRPVEPGGTDSARNHYRQLYEQALPSRLRAEEHTAQIAPEKARTFQEDFEKGLIHFLSCSTTFELGVDLGDLDTIFLRNVPPEPFNYAQRVGRAGRRASHPGFAVTYCRRRPHDLAHFQDPRELMAGRTAPPLLKLTNAKIVGRHLTAVVLSEFFRKLGNESRFESVAAFLVNMKEPVVVADLARFAADSSTDLNPQLRRLAPRALHASLGLDDGTWIQQIITDAETRLASVVSEVSSDYARVEQFEEEASRSKRHRDADWAHRRAETISGEDVISFLSRKAVIPKYGFPVDVVELDLQPLRRSSRESSEVTLQRDLSIAVSEFAPGCRLVANKKLWTSYGLKRVAEREWGWRHYRRCNRHGTFVSWELNDQPPERPCCAKVVQNTYVDPIFGFVTERKAPEDPSYRPARVYTTRPYFLGPGGVEPETIEIAGVASVRKASPGRLVVLCEGKKGRGFTICQNCGAGVDERAKEHKTPLGEQCRGALRRVTLGHEFLTDVLRVRFHQRPASAAAPDGMLWFGFSLAYALLYGAHEILEVPRQDLNVTVRGGEGDEVPEVVLYDDVPGGAGLVARLEEPEAFHECLVRARARVLGSCGCAADTSCYGCLRSYANQFAHPRLRRGAVKGYLDEVLGRWRSGNP